MVGVRIKLACYDNAFPGDGQSDGTPLTSLVAGVAANLPNPSGNEGPSLSTSLRRSR
jgi:hypothetical protein